MSKVIDKLKWIFRSRVRVAIFLVVFIGLGVAGWMKFSGGQTGVQYQTSKVEKGTIVSTVSASGRVLSANMISVTSGVSGVISKVYVKDGDKVATGQRIAEVTLDLAGQQKSAQAWSSYLAAKNSLDTANVSLYTLQSQLFAANQKFINDAVARDLESDDPTYIQENADWLAAEAKYKNQSAVINQSAAALSSVWLSYRSAAPVITAPVTGTVSDLSVVVGMVVGGTLDGSSSSDSQRVAVIRTGNKPILSFDLPEIDVSNVKVEQKVTVSLDSLADKTFTGKVVAVDRIGSVSNNVTSYPAVVQLDADYAGILPNMAASAEIILDSKGDVLKVPSAAVREQDGVSVVRLLREGGEQEVTVEVGLSSDSETEIVSGLAEGDEVIMGTATASSTSQSSGSVFGGMFGGGALRQGGFSSGSQRR